MRLQDAGWLSAGVLALSVLGACGSDDKKNRDPVLISSALTGSEDVLLAVQLAASDPDRDALTFTRTSDVQHGTITVSAAGMVLYTPAANYNGTDSFGVSVSDGEGGTATGTVTITVAAVNDLPVLTSTQFQTAEDSALTVQLTATDVEGDPITFNAAGGGAHGVFSVSATGLLQYTPAANYNGADTLQVGAGNGAASLVQDVAVTITPVNDPPQANDDQFRVAAAATVTFAVVANDVDVDGETLSVQILDPPAGGTATVNAANEVTFTRDARFNGPITLRYRITDAAGVTADATVRAVVGEFPGLYYLSDELTVGRTEFFFFDGIEVTRINSPLTATQSIAAFSVSDDGTRLAYVVEDTTFDYVYVVAPGSTPNLVYTSAFKDGSFGSLAVNMELNRNGSHLRVYDTYRNRALPYIVRAADGALTLVGGNTNGIAQGGYFAFSPAGDFFYPQLQVGGLPPPASGSGYLTMFRGNLASAGDVAQIGLTYPAPSLSGGSGFLPAVTADGRYVVHQEVLFSPVRSSVLVFDTVSGIEAPIYRRPVSGEIGMWNGFSLSADGQRVCFLFREPGSGSSGPSRYVAGSPASPASAVPITPVVDVGYTCSFGSDNRTMFYHAQTASAPAMQVYSIDAAAPGTPVLVNRALGAGEQLDGTWIARDAMRLVFGFRGAHPNIDYYSVSLDDPGTFITFATNTFDDGGLPAQLDAEGFMFAYSKRPTIGAGLRRLTLLSTQTANYQLSLTRADSTTGVRQFEWAP
jgi:VCBS repeat-containing protein